MRIAHPADALIAFHQLNRPETTVPGTSTAATRTGGRVIQCAVGGADQEFRVGLEEVSRLPVELHLHVRAAVQIGVNAASMPNSKGGHDFAAEQDREAHAPPAVNEFVRRTQRDHDLVSSHGCSSRTLSTSASAPSVSSWARGCAP